MNTTLQTMLSNSADGTPEQQMLQLGKLYATAQKARLKSYTQGLMAIHNQICDLQDVITKKQSVLLAAYPELVLMAL